MAQFSNVFLYKLLFCELNANEVNNVIPALTVDGGLPCNLARAVIIFEPFTCGAVVTYVFGTALCGWYSLCACTPSSNLMELPCLCVATAFDIAMAFTLGS